MTRNGWGLVGTGRIADDRILPGINAYEGNRLIGVVSRDQGRADAFAKKFGAQHATRATTTCCAIQTLR